MFQSAIRDARRGVRQSMAFAFSITSPHHIWTGASNRCVIHTRHECSKANCLNSTPVAPGHTYLFAVCMFCLSNRVDWLSREWRHTHYTVRVGGLRCLFARLSSTVNRWVRNHNLLSADTAELWAAHFIERSSFSWRLAGHPPKYWPCCCHAVRMLAANTLRMCCPGPLMIYNVPLEFNQFPNESEGARSSNAFCCPKQFPLKWTRCLQHECVRSASAMPLYRCCSHRSFEDCYPPQNELLKSILRPVKRNRLN